MFDNCDSLNKIIYNNGTDGEITLEDTIIGDNFLDNLEIKMELELAVEKELITQEEIDIVMDIKVYKVKKRELKIVCSSSILPYILSIQ